MRHVSGKYVQGELLDNIREIEDWITDYAVANSHEVSDATLRADMDRRVRDASFGRNAVMFDDKNYPSIMVRFPFTRLIDLNSNWGNAPHEAFIQNGVTKNEFWAGKYLPIVVGSGADARAVSLRRRDPKHTIDFDDSWKACIQKGAGWHLLTNAEWALILMKAHKTQWFCRGNNSYGRDYVRTDETAEATLIDASNRPNRTATGTGPVSWSHDGTPFGVFDLNGNIWKWVGGLRLVDGEIQILENNNAADHTKDQTNPDSLTWKAILQDGSLVAPGTADTLKLDATNADGSGNIELGTSVDNQSDGTTSANTLFKDVATKPGITAPDILKRLGLFPMDANYPHGRAYMRNLGERLPSRGGSWVGSSVAGLPSLYLYDPRDAAVNTRGFALAYQG